MSRYVLVHGSWHGAWCWEKVVPFLKKAGHEVVAFDLLGHGSDKTPVPDISLEGYAKQTVEALEGGTEPSILVGHSFGGVVISQAAESHPDQIKHLVFVCAFMPGNGESLKTWFDQDTESLVGPNLVIDQNGTATIKEEALPETFYGGCSPEDTKWAINQLVPEPMAPIATPVSLTKEHYGSVSRIYIEALRDQALTNPIQKKMVEANPCDVITMKTAHSPWLSDPDALSAYLLKLG